MTRAQAKVHSHRKMSSEVVCPKEAGVSEESHLLGMLTEKARRRESFKTPLYPFLHYPIINKVSIINDLQWLNQIRCQLTQYT